MLKLRSSIYQLRYGKLFFITLLALIATPLSNAYSELIDRVVAEVNNDVITLSELNEEGESFIRRIITEVPAQDRDLALQRAYQDILDGLIDKLLISQEAARQGIVVTEEEMEAAVNRIISASNLSRDRSIRSLLKRAPSVSNSAEESLFSMMWSLSVDYCLQIYLWL